VANDLQKALDAMSGHKLRRIPSWTTTTELSGLSPRRMWPRVIGLWIVLQLFSGIGSIANTTDTGVAHGAHRRVYRRISVDLCISGESRGAGDELNCYAVICACQASIQKRSISIVWNHADQITGDTTGLK
jgi:hypothetical protein